MARRMTQQQLLDLAAVLPEDKPCTAAEADALGVSNHQRRILVRAGLIRSSVKGVFHPAGLRDSLELRLAILRLVVPADCVVTDRTAAWLWGASMALAPGDHLVVPRVSVFAPPGRRLRNGLVRSGERQLHAMDVVELGGVQVTTPIRTACDVLRLLHRDQAVAAADALASLGRFVVDDLAYELLRFKGYRGVVQARALAPLVDPASQSPMESISRLRWYDAGLPRPQCQVVESAADGSWYAIDIGLPDARFGLEFFGEQWHGEGAAAHDEERLDWLRDQRGWTLVVARGANVVGPYQDLVPTLQLAWMSHQSRLTA